MPISFFNRRGNAGTGKGLLTQLGHKMTAPIVKAKGAAYEAKKYTAKNAKSGQTNFQQDQASRGLLGKKTFNDGSPLPAIKGGLNSAPGMNNGPHPLELPKAPGA